jgi:hypothetical protein
MYQISNVKIPGGALISFECDTEEEVFRRMNFFQQMPHVCPIDNSETIYFYRKDDEGNSYCSIASAQNPQHSYKFGKRKGIAKELFPKGWYEWDAPNQCNWYWRDGSWFAVDDDGKPLWDKPRPGSKAAAQRTPEPAMQQLDAEIAAILPTQTATVREVAPDPVLLGAARRIFDDTGLDAYGPGWTKKRLEVAKWASGDRTTDYMQLSVGELNRANVQLAKAKEKAYSQTVAA